MEKSYAREHIQIREPRHILPLLTSYGKERQEHFIVVTLTARHEVIRIHAVTKGIATKTMTHPRECFYPAIIDNAASVLFAHNHPSGDCIPSVDDQELTDRLCKAAHILGFHVLDHVVFWGNGREQTWYSFRENGILPGDFSGYDMELFVQELKEELKERNRI